MAPAAVSALMLYIFFDLSLPKGAITGINPLDRILLIFLLLIFDGLPTKPKSKMSYNPKYIQYYEERLLNIHIPT